MIGYISGLINCAQGKHSRSEGRVRKRDGVYYSNCRYCRIGMRRLSKRVWTVDRNAVK